MRRNVRAPESTSADSPLATGRALSAVPQASLAGAAGCESEAALATTKSSNQALRAAAPSVEYPAPNSWEGKGRLTGPPAFSRTRINLNQELLKRGYRYVAVAEHGRFTWELRGP